ncbi:glycosyl hydrolase [Pseudoalteromonas sp. OOF1S-7]|uniref:VPS10 domain-containing protein n=1 Tax=Pseudoalteromonas sp. OOF1S-7 TaxID=2917757 RepID=UPI001EF5DA7C|nr:glycosyl hydrolase [Pseudoalteromonas sp. OOF1S-7]MCG7534631.1 glycosyl hydrolase [Pseudoalteromonas sp. OOF1S-7]
MHQLKLGRTMRIALFGAATVLCSLPGLAAKGDEGVLSAATFKGLELRNIGPGFMSGRIADIAIDPRDTSVWYVGVGSGGVWKTNNAGVTWQPIFDDQPVYSIGAVVLDPNNSNTVWVGTGENVGGRHVSFGDGIYVSHDGGANWTNMGLKNSGHISEIIVHPTDSNTLWVAAQGPLWSKGGQRGLYKTTDGGKTWDKVLGDNDWTGVTDVAIDPRDPNVLYAATWQRHRTVAAYYGGGSGSGLHKSTDGGKTWQKLVQGLPPGEMGKIGLEVSPINPDVVYAAIELNRRTGAVYRSADRGASWVKGADAVAGGTGPHYYQELYASPHHFDHIYLAGVRLHESKDGGKSFKRMEEKDKHGDNHAMEFIAGDKNYMMVGSDGGLYESFDSGVHWRYHENLPVTQYYKLALDDDKPFYNIYGGTQDNNTQGGPSRTLNSHGILNTDWKVVLFGDGHQPATEPGNPDIVYAQWQQGNLTRYDRTTGEIVYIKPQPGKGEKPERFNWDAPILVSPHKPSRLYFASHRVWQSQDRGDSWTPISGDLTKNRERIHQPIMGGKQGWDGAWDMFAMSQYSTITSLSESPLVEGLLYAGTDDGHIQITENGGKSWRKVDVKRLPKVPDTAFINDIKADLFDPDTVYIALDNHKFGDYKPYLLKSTNRGKSWKSIASNLPDKHLVWRVVQDHVDPDLLFAGTEFGLFFTIDGGKRWVELTGNVPTISFRDLAIQRRENDLVGASFGRGFFVLDDYRALRNLSEDKLAQESLLFPTRDALWYIERSPLGGGEVGTQGGNKYRAPNPDFGATFTYYLKDDIKSLKAQRQEKEKALKEDDKSFGVPSWESLEAEERQQQPVVWFTVRDAQGNVIRKLQGKANKGLHRINWDLRWPAHQAIGVQGNYFSPNPQGPLVTPGTYSVSMSKEVDGQITQLQASQTFEVVQLNQRNALKEIDGEKVAAFWKELADVQRVASATGQALGKAVKRLDMLEQSLDRTSVEPGEFDSQFATIRSQLLALDSRLNGNPAKNQVGAWNNTATVGDRLFHALIGTSYSTYGPTPAIRTSVDLATQELRAIRNELQIILSETIPAFEQQLQAKGAPWLPGQSLPQI